MKFKLGQFTQTQLSNNGYNVELFGYLYTLPIMIKVSHYATEQGTIPLV